MSKRSRRSKKKKTSISSENIITGRRARRKVKRDSTFVDPESIDDSADEIEEITRKAEEVDDLNRRLSEQLQSMERNVSRSDDEKTGKKRGREDSEEENGIEPADKKRKLGEEKWETNENIPVPTLDKGKCEKKCEKKKMDGEKCEELGKPETAGYCTIL